MIQSSPIEADVWRRVIRPDQGGLTNEAAQALADLRFEQSDLDAMHDLAARNQAGTLSAEETLALESYRRVGMVVDLLRAKGRQSLRQQERNS